MKKYFFIVICLVIVGKLFAQNSPAKNPYTQKYEYDAVIELKDSINKNDLWSRAKSFILTNYNFRIVNLLVEDRNEGKIVAVVYNYLPTRGAGTVVNGKIVYTFTIYVKDNRYKYAIDNMIHKYTEVGVDMSVDRESPLENSNPGLWVKKSNILNDVHKVLSNEILKFNDYMASKNHNTLDSKW